MKTPILSAIAALAISAIGITWAARDGSGTYMLPSGSPVSTGTAISSTWANTTLSDIATALTNSLSKDGQTVPTANLPMGGFKHTNVADATARNQYATAGQVQDFGSLTLSSVSGTNTVIGSLNPPLTSYVGGMPVSLIPASNNTGATTLSINGLSARSVVKYDGDALVSGDLVAGIPAFLITSSSQFILLNPQSATLTNGIAISDLARLSQGNVFASSQTIAATASAEKLRLIAVDSVGDNYIHGYSSDGSTPRWYIGNGGTADNHLTLHNYISGAELRLQTSGGVGLVTVNGQNVRDAGLFTSGTLADARIAQSNVTQHQAALTTRNISGKAGIAKTLSTSAASGGGDGDIWYRY